VLKIGVLMPGDAAPLGEYLADARALETAGAHALWLDEGAQDPWMLAAALATVTSRARLGVSVTRGVDAAALVPRLRTLDALSRGRAEVRAVAACAGPACQLARAVDRSRFVGVADEEGWTAVAGMADGLVLSGREPEEDRARIERARARVGLARPPAPLECWIQVKLPDSHASWRRTLAAYGAAGADGLLVPLDARLVDLLRRGDDEDDRSDLTLSQG
jgi:alkanesulfonate monooxygenase SsuD/methylene tetrahydromethanopterin reductase-like flavin-dependent oxidoreductase (luciferase family)